VLRIALSPEDPETFFKLMDGPGSLKKPERPGADSNIAAN
jgi:hypothetical protein